MHGSTKLKFGICKLRGSCKQHFCFDRPLNKITAFFERMPRISVETIRVSVEATFQIFRDDIYKNGKGKGNVNPCTVQAPRLCTQGE